MAISFEACGKRSDSFFSRERCVFRSRAADRALERICCGQFGGVAYPVGGISVGRLGTAIPSAKPCGTGKA